MDYRKYFLSVIIFLSAVYAEAQSTVAGADNTQLENIAGENDENVDLSELEDQKNFLLENPVNLSRATREELLTSGLFDESKAAALIEHRSKNGSLLCLEELQSIDGFDLPFIISILPYLKLSGPFIDPHLNLTALFKNGKSQLVFRTQRVLEEQKGFKVNEEGKTSYPGTPFRHYMRYRFAAGRYFSMGITAENDAGEDFFGGVNKKGFDFYSFHLFMRPGKFVKALALGDYQVQFGQGLIAWSGLAFGKSSEVTAVKKQASGIKPYSSSNEFGFLRGAAIVLNHRCFTLSNWISYRKMDANIASDTSASEEEITSIGMAGYHRTAYEIEDKNVLKQSVAGSNLSFIKKSFRLGYTAMAVSYNLPMQKGNEAYEIYNPSGKQFFNQGIDYSFRFRNFNFFGEAALDEKGNTAYLNGLIISADRIVSFSVVQRNYPVGYNAMYANAIREGSKVKNEKAVYAGLQIQLMKSLKAAVYIDIFKFPWLRYRLNAPSYGNEKLFQLTYAPARTTEIYFRIRSEMKQENEEQQFASVSKLVFREKLNLRLNVSFKIAGGIILQNRAEHVFLKKEGSKDEGIFFMQEVQYKPMGKSYSFAACYSLFKTGSYDSRLYCYEQDLPGAGGIPAYYYNGERYYLLFRKRILRGFDAAFKISRSKYADRQEIGSGNDLIEADHKTELKIQFRYSF